MAPSEWRPGRKEAAQWNVAAVAVVVVGVVLFGLPVLLRIGQSKGEIRVTLLGIGIVILLTALLAVVHEAVHGAVMLIFGARPTFGALLVARMMPAIYATSEGHVFRRGQYLAVAMSPAVLISVLGFWACFAPVGGYLIFPLAVHLGGCVGDAAASWKVLRQPPGTLFEDLKDGIRFHSPA